MNNKITKLLNHFAMNGYSRLAGLSRECGRVLMFHNIGNSDGELNLDVASFEQILQNASERCIDLLDWESIKYGGGKFYALTFDDVKYSFYENAYPLLKRYNCPFTIFVNCELLDKLGYISSDDLRELALDPLCTIGSHGLKHTFFSKYTNEEALADMKKSKETLQGLTGREVKLFAFPYGSFAACGWRKHKLVKAVYKYGFSTINAPMPKRSLISFGFLPRLNVDNNTFKKIYP